jgi:hypothetical protein
VNTVELYNDHIELMGVYNISELTQRTLITTMNTNLEWIQRHSEAIQEFLDKHVNASGRLKVMWSLIVGALMIKMMI